MVQEFGAQSTTDDVLAGIDLTGKRALVTGASAGIGVETVRALVTHGAEVVGAARDVEKGKAALAQVLSGGGATMIALDLGSLASVRACADTLLAAGKKFDLVICNAGVMGCPKGTTQDGFETHFGTNHLGHFVLVNRIASLLNPGARLVSVSSSGQAPDLDLDDLNFEHTEYDAFLAYGRSKTANALFAVEFDRRHKAAGIRAAAVNPGVIKTELARYIGPEASRQLVIALDTIQPDGKPAATWKSTAQGAATSLWAAVTAPAEMVGGRICEDCHVGEVSDNPAARSGFHAYAVDPARAQALWAKSEQLVGESF